VSWLGRLLRRKRLERQLDAELGDHIARSISDAVAQGVPEAEARRRARLTLGGVEQIKEQCRDTRGTRWLEEFAGDVRYGWGLLREHRGFAVVAVLSLALGIGANTAIFSIVDHLLLRSLPVQAPERLVLLDHGSWTHPIWTEIRDRRTALFEDAAAW